MATMDDDSRWDLRQAVAAVQELVSTRGWERFHVPRYLVAALCTEASELLDLTLWKQPEEIDKLFADHAMEVSDELADILINLLSLIACTDLDPNAAVKRKVNILLARHADTPLGSARGASSPCGHCSAKMDPSWLWCPTCGTPGANSANRAAHNQRPEAELPKAGHDHALDVRHVDDDLALWDRVATSYWASRPPRVRWVGQHVLLPAIERYLSPEVREILDVGCGDASLSGELCRRRGIDLIAYDPSPQMRHLAAVEAPRGRFVASMNEIDDESIYAATMTMVLSSVGEPFGLLADTHRVLQRTGCLIVTVPHPCFTLLRDLHHTTTRRWLESQPSGSRAPILPNLPEDLRRYFGEPVEQVTWKSSPSPVFTHLYNRTFETYMEMFTESGFRVRSICEPRPVDGAEDEPTLARLYADLPGFMCFQLMRDN